MLNREVVIKMASLLKLPKSDNVVLLLESTMGHKKSDSGSLIQLLYAVVYQKPLLISPNQLSGDLYLEN